VGEDDDALLLICVGTDGQRLWQKTVGKGNRNVTLVPTEGNSASPSPATDGAHVWVFFGTGILACYDYEGREVWKFDVQDRYGKFNIQFGMTSTPILDGDRLYLQLIHGDGKAETREATVACLDKATGKQIWRQERPSPAYAENEHSYASPTIYRDDQQAFLLTHGADYLVAHSLDDGRELWRSGGLQPSNYDRTLRLVSSPVAVPGLIVAPSAKGGNVIAVKPGGSGDVTGTKLNPWRFSPTPDVPSPLIYDGLVYLYRETGVLLVLDAESGKLVYEMRTPGEKNRASPVWADGNVYLLNRNGTTTVFKAGRQFEQVASNELGEITSSSPAISNGRIYIRSFEALWAIGK
jgi:outer membrane protein assembly factor BamB